jgi:hypothetical protein
MVADLAWHAMALHERTTVLSLQDPEGFIEDGGWSFLDADQSDSEDEDGEESSEFAPRYDFLQSRPRKPQVTLFRFSSNLFPLAQR